MTENDREHFVLLIGGLASAYGIEPTTALKLGYWMGLKTLPLADIERAINRALETCKFMPRPVELRELAGEITLDQRAVLAWDALRKAIRQHGTYASVDFDDPVINAAVRSLGGWSMVCAKDPDEFEKWTRKEFERLYASLCASGTSAESMLHLAGRHEIDNGSNGFEIEAPRVVATGLPEHRADVLARIGATPERLREITQQTESLQ